MDSEARKQSHRLACKKWRDKNAEKNRSYYWKHRDYHLDYRRNSYAKRIAILRRLKQLRGCATCGFREHHAALVFHHVDPNKKAGAVAYFARGSLSAARAELAKCVVLCRNCHAIAHDKEKEGG